MHGGRKGLTHYILGAAVASGTVKNAVGFESDSDWAAPFRLLRVCRCRNRHDAEKNGDCAIAFSASTEKTRTRRQSGKNVRHLAKVRKNRPLHARVSVCIGLNTASEFGTSPDSDIDRLISRRRALPIGSASAPVFRFTGLPYVYVVTVNKVPRFLWITSVYRDDSWACERHNQMHSMCGSGG